MRAFFERSKGRANLNSERPVIALEEGRHREAVVTGELQARSGIAHAGPGQHIPGVVIVQVDPGETDECGACEPERRLAGMKCALGCSRRESQ